MAKKKNKDHNHVEGTECAFCLHGAEAVHAKEEQGLKEFGWFAHMVFDDPNYPFNMNIHTHGLVENFKHVDLQICLSMPPQTIHTILVNVTERIREGKTYEAGKTYDDIIEPSPEYASLKYKVLFLEATEGDRKVLRLIMPDKDGRFSGDFSGAQMKGCKLPEGLLG